MRQITEEFLCNIKADVYHTFADQFTYWAIIRPSVFLLNLEQYMSPVEFWLFLHGWLILLIWRLINAAIDSAKRIRDYGKPEWISNVQPLIRAEVKRDRKMGFWARFWRFLKEAFFGCFLLAALASCESKPAQTSGPELSRMDSVQNGYILALADETELFKSQIDSLKRQNHALAVIVLRQDSIIQSKLDKASRRENTGRFIGGLLKGLIPGL